MFINDVKNMQQNLHGYVLIIFIARWFQNQPYPFAINAKHKKLLK